ncbi:stage IV sporulation protein A [Thermaerobacter marianensis DSM 12885]|uniref:Stage IV sporulation protein A n=1 Tax=Thermaerobacter marianensis (strain ATCC 700841 / DSM 12885 / JCM 10246 / 7p75a) TaxID=644966 RepID=E6SKL1_THEM7|nr:stage IV sporulation protein A [Thermaerobacter marianensis]ADU51219.1 stage IV sporulation protein A [Thermaerobacter marianensis DSM 12885]
MERYDIFQDIAERTGGDLYLGVVGPVRAGKSTFVKKFVELLVLPNIANEHDRQRTQDAIPQSGAGRTITTAEPKFIPDEAVEIHVKEGLTVRVRLVDSVGFPVPGAIGYTEADGPRMVTTPWFEEDIPFEEAAVVGTRKIITEHSTLGVVVTTDGSFGEIPRENFVEAEQQVIRELKELGKPFVVLLNTADPLSPETAQLAETLAFDYDVQVIPIALNRVGERDLLVVLEQLLLEFPVRELVVRLPAWVEELDEDFWLRRHYADAIGATVQNVERLRDVERAIAQLGEYQHVEKVDLEQLDLGTGVATVDVSVPEDLFWLVLGEISGMEIRGKENLVRLVRDLSRAKAVYDRIGRSLEAADEHGYAVVMPALDDLVFEEPEMVRRGGQFGVRLRASAPTLHLFRTVVSTEVAPMIGSEKQSQQLVNYLMEKFEDDPRKIWESDIFGKSLDELLKEGIEDKIRSMPENAQAKIREALERIANEGSGNLICIII